VQIPEQGQIVTVRQRRYAVTDILARALPSDPLHTSKNTTQHLVSLNCIEDDALGESLHVIWELEPGTRVDEKVGLPEPVGFDSPRRLAAFLDAVQWGAVSSADVKALQAPFRSGIEIEDYQLDPLVRAVQMPRVNLLIADAVGLGKTIEAGLVEQELIVRNRARTVLIVCPSGLQVQWHDQMRDKFGLEFRIVDSELMKDLRRKRGIHVNPWTHFPRLITSIDFLKRDRPMRLFREVLPAENEAKFPRRFDILIVDEAHNVAPQGRGKYATDSQRTLAIRALAPHFEQKLFLTATPHNGYPESFSALLELLDNQRFARGVIAIKVSGCVPERFFFARRFCPPQVVKGGAVFRMAKNKRHPQERLPLFIPTAARTKYGLSMVGANGLITPTIIVILVRTGDSVKFDSPF